MSDKYGAGEPDKWRVFDNVKVDVLDPKMWWFRKKLVEGEV